MNFNMECIINMNNLQSNKLLYEYQNSIQNNIPFQNNMLLQNNQLFNNNMQYNSAQMQQMQKIKEMQQIKQLEKLNELSLLKSADKIKESVIRPEKLNDKNVRELETKWKDIESRYINKKTKDYGPEIKKYWENRTNEPYKNILKNENYSRSFKTKDDLIVHCVTQKDKEGVDKEYNEMDKNREKHNNELKMIYSTDQENEHKRKFEYNHVYKYRVKYDTKDHTQLKQDKIKYYKERQQKEEEGKNKIDSIMETLVNDGIFNQDELQSINISITEDNKQQNNKQEDTLINKKQAYLDRKNKNKN